MAIRKRQLVGVMVTTARAVTVQPKSPAHLRRIPTMSSISASLEWKKLSALPFTHNILRDYGRVKQPKLIRDVAVKQKVLLMLESVTRGIDRLEAVLKRIDPNTVQALLTKLQVSSLGQIADIKTLQNVVLGLEELTGSNPLHAA